MEETKILNYLPSEKEVKVINRVFYRFQKMKEERDKARHEFDGMTLTEYVNASMDAYNGIVSEELKATKEDWQSVIWDHKTRGKVKTTISLIIGMRPFISITGKRKVPTLTPRMFTRFTKTLGSRKTERTNFTFNRCRLATKEL